MGDHRIKSVKSGAAIPFVGTFSEVTVVERATGQEKVVTVVSNGGKDLERAVQNQIDWGYARDKE